MEPPNIHDLHLSNDLDQRPTTLQYCQNCKGYAPGLCLTYRYDLTLFRCPTCDNFTFNVPGFRINEIGDKNCTKCYYRRYDVINLDRLPTGYCDKHKIKLTTLIPSTCDDFLSLNKVLPWIILFGIAIFVLSIL